MRASVDPERTPRGTGEQRTSLTLFSVPQRERKTQKNEPLSLEKNSTCFYRRKSLFFHEVSVSTILIDYSEASRILMFLVRLSLLRQSGRRKSWTKMPVNAEKIIRPEGTSKTQLHHHHHHQQQHPVEYAHSSVVNCDRHGLFSLNLAL